MKKITLFAALLLAVILGACSTDQKSRVNEILEGVPVSSEAVAVMRSDLLEQAGMGSLRSITGADADVDTTAVAVFIYKGYAFATGLGKVEKSERVVEADGRWWAALQGVPTDDLFASLTSLRKEQSVASTPFAEALEADAQLTARISMSQFTSENPKARMALAMLFDDANSLVIKGDMQKGAFTGDGYIATTKGERAKFLLPTGTIDPNVVGKLKGTDAEIVIAMAAPNKMVRKVVALLMGADGGLMAGMGPDALSLINAIDGTIAAAISPESSDIVVSLTDDNQQIRAAAASVAAALSATADKPAKATVEDRMLRLVSGDPQGAPAILGNLTAVKDQSLVVATQLPANEYGMENAVLSFKFSDKTGNELHFELSGDLTQFKL